MTGVGVTLIAAHLGVPVWRVRRVITRHDIQPVGQSWKELMYDPLEVIRHARNDGLRDTLRVES